jgi:hypothetical protein
MSQRINEFQIWVVQTQEDGAGAHPGVLAMMAKIEEGRLVVTHEGEPGDAEDAECEKVAKVIRRKLQPKSGNQLFVS